MPFGGGVVPGTQPVADGAQFVVPIGAGVAAGVVEFAGVVASAPGAGVVVLGVTTAGVGGAVLGIVDGTAVVPVLPVPVWAPAAIAESIVHATAKQAMAKKAPP